MLTPYEPHLLRRISASESAGASLDAGAVEDKAALAAQFGALSRVAALARRRAALLAAFGELSQLAASAELKAEALSEASQTLTELDAVCLSLVRALTPDDEHIDSNDSNDIDEVLLELRAGTGGAEAALFMREVLGMYLLYCRNRGWRVDGSDGGGGGVDEREAAVEVRGEGALRLRHEAGVHRVQRVPATETMGRVHTSTMTVAVMPLASPAEVRLDPKELRVDTYRSSGKGGQHVNKVESAVRITHLPTQTVVAIQDERSQHRNRERAMGILRARLLQKKKEEERAARDGARRDQIGSAARSERIRTYNFPQSRITDHRLQKSVFGIEAMMQGEYLDEFIDELIDKEMEANLKEIFREN